LQLINFILEVDGHPDKNGNNKYAQYEEKCGTDRPAQGTAVTPGTPVNNTTPGVW